MHSFTHQTSGLRKVSDTHGNSVSFTREGVSHSTGVDLRFIRDAARRIVRMELPDGTVLRNEYVRRRRSSGGAS